MGLKLFGWALVIALSLTVALSLTAPTATHADPSSNPVTVDCMGVERGERNRRGGDRELGGFGPGQAGFVKIVSPYGQWLKGGDCPPAP